MIWAEGDITYERIPEVFDCWVESGSMPWAQDHYPFENHSDSNVREAKDEETKEQCFTFFQEMWKEEFGRDFTKSKR